MTSTQKVRVDLFSDFRSTLMSDRFTVGMQFFAALVSFRPHEFLLWLFLMIKIVPWKIPVSPEIDEERESSLLGSFIPATENGTAKVLSLVSKFIVELVGLSNDIDCMSWMFDIYVTEQTKELVLKTRARTVSKIAAGGNNTAHLILLGTIRIFLSTELTSCGNNDDSTVQDIIAKYAGKHPFNRNFTACGE